MRRFTAVLSALIAIYLACAVVWNASRDPLLGVDVTTWNAAARPPELVGTSYPLEEMRHWAAAYDVDVVVAGSPSADMQGVVAGVPARQGSEFSKWTVQGYPCLRNPCQMRAVDLEQHPTIIEKFEPGVAYLAFMGDRSLEAGQAAQKYFLQKNWAIELEAGNDFSFWRGRALALGSRTMVAAALLVFLLAGGATLRSGRRAGLQVLHGQSRPLIAMNQCLAWSGSIVGLGIGLVLAASGVAATQIPPLFVIPGTLLALVFILGLVIVCVTAISASQFLLSRLTVLEAVKGRTVSVLAIPVVYVIRGISVIMCVGIVTTLSVSVAQRRELSAVLSDPGPLVAASRYGVNAGASDNPQIANTIGSQIQPLYQDGSLLMANVTPMFFVSSDAGSPLDVSTEGVRYLLEASPALLRVSKIMLEDGRLLDPDKDLNPRAMTVLVPKGLPSKSRRDVEEYAATVFAAGNLGTVPGWDTQRVPVDVVEVPSGQVLMGRDGAGLRRAVSPVVLVYPRALVPGPDFALTGDGLLFRDQDVRRTLDRAPALRSSVSDVATLVYDTRRTDKEIASSMAAAQVEFFGFLAILVISTLAATAMYCSQYSRRIFVRAVAGAGLVAMAPLLVTLDICSGLGILWLSRPRSATLGQLNVYGTHAVSVPWLIFTSTVVVLALLAALEFTLLRRNVLEILRTGGR
ncbi:hypothetical protein GCM10027030_15310 [Luteococcus sediminum]|uniref:hypothetical protein n=1 Tax=Luteococcus sp. TaxID=1969402 RepID=UPI003736E4FC